MTRNENTTEIIAFPPPETAAQTDMQNQNQNPKEPVKELPPNYSTLVGDNQTPEHFVPQYSNLSFSSWSQKSNAGAGIVVIISAFVSYITFLALVFEPSEVSIINWVFFGLAVIITTFGVQAVVRRKSPRLVSIFAPLYLLLFLFAIVRAVLELFLVLSSERDKIYNRCIEFNEVLKEEGCTEFARNNVNSQIFVNSFSLLLMAYFTVCIYQYKAILNSPPTYDQETTRTHTQDAPDIYPFPAPVYNSDDNPSP